MDLVYGRIVNGVPTNVITSQSSKNIGVRPMLVPQWGGSQQRVSSIVQLRQSRLNKALPLVHEDKEGGPQISLPQSNYSELISTLPARNDWKFMPLHQYQGFWYFTVYLEALLAAQEKFQAQPDDLVLCTYPKTGTTWLKALAFAITTRSRYSISESPLLTSTPHDCVPFLEVEIGTKKACIRDPENPLVATHIPYGSLPTSITALGCKMVYFCRDPKDVLVSMWHFLRARLPEGIDKDAYCSMDDSFESFCEGIALNGPYWDHVAGYWKASQEHPEKVLFLKYEDLKEDTVSNVRKLADFLGYPFTPEEERQGVVQEIVDLCSFENLKNLKATKDGVYSSDSPFIMKNSLFYRKGNSGDWKNYFTEEMGARLDQIVEQKLSGSGFSFLSR
ncbi:flavonol sulfotransferase-like [Ricinus communis]|uniref:Sulfotransferase n=1 Tax=Ricinus communis TaxID=3988 RepID=B9SEF3_RICCO|nr:flavonol sulfotransferase-like [Ricinus communis]EEF37983.1 Flavonol 4'-sulfotransferase, putative [Ricinus communis]|eukprot:XP_002524372.1 flavonol sulfotransferase-like [Ricinus communis]